MKTPTKTYLGKKLKENKAITEIEEKINKEETPIEQQLLNKSVKIFLKNNYCYTGTILSITSDSILILDKFGLHVSINNNEVSTIVEQK